MPIDSVLHTNHHSIDRVVNAGLPVVLVFWDRNRSLAKALDAELDRLAAKYVGRALIARVNVEEEGELLQRYQMSAVPSFAFIDNGRVIERSTLEDSAYVDAWLNHLTNGGPQPPQPASTHSARRTNGNGSARASSGDAGGRAAQPGGNPVTLTDANFRSVISSPLPVLVDFWAEWCGPCRMVAPSVEQLASEFDGRAVVGKLNVEENPVTAGQFGVRSIPALLIFKNGQVVDQIVGAQPLPVLRQRLGMHTR